MQHDAFSVNALLVFPLQLLTLLFLAGSKPVTCKGPYLRYRVPQGE